METRNFGIREKIIAGFLVLVVLFGLDGIYNLITINNSQKLLWGFMNEKDPSIKSLNQFCANINILVNVSSGIVYNNPTQGSSNVLIEPTILETKKQLVSNSLFWDAPEEKVLLKSIMIDLDSLTKSFTVIKNYKLENSPMADSAAIKSYTTKIIPLSLKILENSNILIHTKEIEKENYKQKLTSSFSALKNGIFTLGGINYHYLYCNINLHVLYCIGTN